MRPISSNYWRDVLWQASGNSIAQVIGIACIPILTRLYTPEDFATQNLLLQLIAFLAGIMTFRFEYFIQLPKHNYQSMGLIALILILGLASCIILMPLSVIYNSEIASALGNQSLATWTWLAPITALLISYALAFQHWVQRNQQYQLSAFSEVAGKASYATIATVGKFLWSGPTGLLLAPISSAIGKLILLISMPASRQLLSQKKSLHKVNTEIIAAAAKSHWRESFSSVLSHLFFTVTSAVPLIFIAHQYGAGSLGQYSLVITTIYLPAGIIGAAIGQVYYQRIAHIQHTNESCMDLWRTTSKRLIIMGLPLYLIIVVLSPWVYPIIFGAQWDDAGVYASIIAVAGFFSFCSSPMDKTCLVAGAWWYPMSWHGLRAASTLIVLYCAREMAWDLLFFLSILSAQISTLYIFDFFCERYFVKTISSKLNDISSR